MLPTAPTQIIAQINSSAYAYICFVTGTGTGLTATADDGEGDAGTQTNYFFVGNAAVFGNALHSGEQPVGADDVDDGRHLPHRQVFKHERFHSRRAMAM